MPPFIRSASIAMCSSLALAGAALAQDHVDAHGHAAGAHADTPPAGVLPTAEQGITPMLVAIGVFLVVFGILSVKVFPMINRGLKDREMKIRTSIEEAEMAQRQARQALEQYERNLASARAEAQKMLDDAKTQQQAITADLKQRADVELAQMRDKAKRDIEAAKSAAVAEIGALAASLATDMAGNILKREVNAGDQQRLMQESLQQLQTAGRA